MLPDSLLHLRRGMSQRRYAASLSPVQFVRGAHADDAFAAAWEQRRGLRIATVVIAAAVMAFHAATAVDRLSWLDSSAFLVVETVGGIAAAVFATVATRLALVPRPTARTKLAWAAALIAMGFGYAVSAVAVQLYCGSAAHSAALAGSVHSCRMVVAGSLPMFQLTAAELWLLWAVLGFHLPASLAASLTMLMVAVISGVAFAHGVPVDGANLRSLALHTATVAFVLAAARLDEAHRRQQLHDERMVSVRSRGAAGFGARPPARRSGSRHLASARALTPRPRRVRLRPRSELCCTTLRGKRQLRARRCWRTSRR